jgi:23S rRNA (cytidine1920-2'-O)/16S rRNA (cytidine1409-2'-O)-methyltransferase
MRLDLYLTKHCSVQSRNKACELIKSNKVKCDGVIISKPSFNVEPNASIELLEEHFYVSRAAYKLKHFLEEIDLNIAHLSALDIGSSTGGFAQILLEKNVQNVTCVDVGSNQLHDKIKHHPNLKFFENTDIRDFKPKKPFELVTCDVSFISIHHLLNVINELSSSKIIILFKPQFEVGSQVKRDKKGVVKNTNAIQTAKHSFLEATSKLHWQLIKSSQSQVLGKQGNHETLYYFTKN